MKRKQEAEKGGWEWRAEREGIALLNRVVRAPSEIDQLGIYLAVRIRKHQGIVFLTLQEVRGRQLQFSNSRPHSQEHGIAPVSPLCHKMVAETPAIMPSSSLSWKEKRRRKKEVRVILITLSYFSFLLLLGFFIRKAKDSSKTSTIAFQMLLNCWIRCMRENVKHLGRNHENLKKSLHSNCLIFVIKFLFPSKIPKLKFWKMHYWCVLCKKKTNKQGTSLGVMIPKESPWPYIKGLVNKQEFISFG